MRRAAKTSSVVVVIMLPPPIAAMPPQKDESINSINAWSGTRQILPFCRLFPDPTIFLSYLTSVLKQYLCGQYASYRATSIVSVICIVSSSLRKLDLDCHQIQYLCFPWCVVYGWQYAAITTTATPVDRTMATMVHYNARKFPSIISLGSLHARCYIFTHITTFTS